MRFLTIRGRNSLPSIGEQLEQAMRAVLDDYRDFAARAVEAGSEAESKAFTARHAACRAALAHLEHLLRLARATSGGAKGEGLDEAEATLASVRGEIAGLRGGGDEHEDGEEPDGGDPAG
jgi:hypothetical protein